MWSAIYNFLISNRFINSNFFTAITTLIVGSAALYLYKKQKRDRLKEAATVILTEINRASEAIPRVLQTIKKNEALDDTIESLQISGWANHKFAFVNLLSPTEWRAVDDFYRNCRIYDDALTTYISYFGEDVKHIYSSLHQQTLKIVQKWNKDNPTEDSIDKDTADHIKNFSNLYINSVANNQFYRPNKHFNDSIRALSTINTALLLSSVGSSLNKIAIPLPWYKYIYKK